MDENRHQEWLDERDDWLELLTASDAMLGLIHEINNSLNSMMLQASIVELKVTGRVKEEVTEIRRLGIRAASQLGMVQQFRDQCRNARLSIDLHAILRDVLAEDLEFATGVELVLADEPLNLMVNASALKRLLRLVLRIARRGQPIGAALQVRTLRRDGRITLFVEPVTFDPEKATAVDWDALADETEEPRHLMERMAVQSLARLIQAKIHASRGSSEEWGMSVQWAN